MRRALWIGLIAGFAACNGNDDDVDSLTRQLTTVRVSPSNFLGDLSCKLDGGMQTYLVTLADVTEGLEGAFILPSSPVVDCTSNVNFFYVQEGHRYVAYISGFDRTDVRSQNPGSPIVVDGNGASVMPKFRTTCWGDDRVAPPGDGGWGGTVEETIGVEAYNDTVVVVGGCEPFQVNEVSKISVNIQPSLFGLTCGTKPGQVDTFSVALSEESDSGGVAAQGGMGGGDSTAPDPIHGHGKCGETVVLDGLPPDIHTDLLVTAFESDSNVPTWGTICTALTRPGATTPARCDPMSEL